MSQASICSALIHFPRLRREAIHLGMLTHLSGGSGGSVDDDAAGCSVLIRLGLHETGEIVSLLTLG